MSGHYAGLKIDALALIVEDDQFTQGAIKEIIASEVDRVLVASNAAEAREVIADSSPHLVVLDINLPDELGFTLAREIRNNHETAIIVLTSRDSDVDRLLGLELGADEYLTKPVNPLELSIRVRNMLDRQFHWKRGEQDHGANGGIVTFGDWIFTPNRRLLENTAGSTNYPPQQLTRLEANVLKLLATSPEQVFGRGDLMVAFEQGASEISERAVDNIIMRLRRKLGESIRSPGHIVTVSGQGYRFTMVPDELGSGS